MRTLYLRNVPDDVYERLARLARAERSSVGALAVRELAEASQRADNAALLDRLPDLLIEEGRIVAHLDEGRDER